MWEKIKVAVPVSLENYWGLTFGLKNLFIDTKANAKVALIKVNVCSVLWHILDEQCNFINITFELKKKKNW